VAKVDGGAMLPNVWMTCEGGVSIAHRIQTPESSSHR
jgi:hypothetical protein